MDLRELARKVESNLPSRKPQLWDDLPFALRRRVELAIGTRLDAAWLDTPRVAALADPTLRMELVLRCQIDRAIFLYGTYEYAATALFRALVQPGDVVLDVGANIGYFALLAARLVGERGSVVAFEPAPRIVGRLRRNVALNALSNVEVDARALSASRGEIDFFESIAADNGGCSSILPGEGRSVTGVRVATLTLDEALREKNIERAKLVKIDVEGAEDLVLAGARELLASKDAPIVLFESFDMAKTAPLLTSAGYAIRALDYDPRARALQFPPPDRARESVFRAYEPPSFVAMKEGRGHPRFEELARADHPARR